MRKQDSVVLSADVVSLKRRWCNPHHW